jgi:hypothetical protein
MYRKYLRFREELIDKKTKTMRMNPISIAIDYICYTTTNLEILLKKYKFKVIYFNINHRIGIINRSANKKHTYDKRLMRAFKDMIYLMESSDISGTYMSYHEYFKKNISTYRIKDINKRKSGYDYNNDLPKLELDFIREALTEQNQLTLDDIFYCNRVILSMLTNTRVIYTETANIDYLKYHKARFIRSKNWRHYKRKESITKVLPLEQTLYQYFSESRKLPLIDCCQTNSYDLFILTDDPYKMYIKNETSIFLDEGLLDDYIEVIDALNERDNRTTVEIDNYTTFIESIEPTEITEHDINIIVESITNRWSSLYSEFDLNKLKVPIKTVRKTASVNDMSMISVDDSTEIV